MIATVSSDGSPSKRMLRIAPGRITALGATELATRLRSGELSAAEVVEAHIARIEQVDTTSNAVVVRRFDEARAEARAADAARESGRPGHSTASR